MMIKLTFFASLWELSVCLSYSPWYWYVNHYKYVFRFIFQL